VLQTETVELIRDAMASMERGLERRIADVYERAQSHAKLLDELKRGIDDVSDETLRGQLLGVLARLDDAHSNLKSDLGILATYDLFDPFRVVVADIRHDL
jgi:hypothetical protein